MRKSIKNAIGNTVEDIIANSGKTSFSVRELNELGVKIPDIEIKAEDIQAIREQTHLSQNVFAKVLNVSSSSVKQWEQGKRIPTGSTKVLLELLRENPEILNYRMFSNTFSTQV